MDNRFDTIFISNKELEEQANFYLNKRADDETYIRKGHLMDLLNKAKSNIIDSTVNDERKVASLSVINTLMMSL